MIEDVVINHKRLSSSLWFIPLMFMGKPTPVMLLMKIRNDE